MAEISDNAVNLNIPHYTANTVNATKPTQKEFYYFY